MSKTWILIVPLCIIASDLSGQDTVFNQLNSRGQKTGFWKVYYENGKVRYTGFFENDQPAGEMKKYYPGGILQAHMIYERSGKVSRVKLFYKSGKLSAEGKYIGNVKDSVWNYYSSYDERLALHETYELGMKNGMSFKYYSNGNISEIIEWDNDLEHGRWEQYYENGDIRLKSSYLHGMRNGPFQSFHPGGKPSITGAYNNGYMNGKWTYFDEDGREDFSAEYIDGKMLPNEYYDKRVEEFSKKIRDIAGDIPEPSEEQIP